MDTGLRSRRLKTTSGQSEGPTEAEGSAPRAFSGCAFVGASAPDLEVLGYTRAEVLHWAQEGGLVSVPHTCEDRSLGHLPGGLAGVGPR